MRLLRTVILTLALTLPLLLSAQDQLYSRREVVAMLVQLDSTIAHKNDYKRMRQQRIDSLQREVSSCPPQQYVEKSKELYDALCDFDGRGSLKVLNSIEQTPEYQADPDLQAWVQLNESQVYGIMGLYNRAGSITSSLQPQQLSKEGRLLYYLTCIRNYENISDYLSDIIAVQDEERDLIAYYDHILDMRPDSITYAFIVARKQLQLHQPDSAYNVIMPQLHKAQGRQHVYLLLTLAAAAEMKGNPQNSTYYLAQAANENIQNGTTEYVALSHLVRTLHDDQDIDRAYQYLMCTMEDANAYPSRSLSLNVSRYFPLINSSYAKHRLAQERSDKRQHDSLVITFVLLGLAIAVSFYMGWRQNALAAEKKRANQLQKALNQATIADRVKTVFIQNMRHEIRTPLNAIMGFAQLMSNDLTPDERATYTRYIQESNDQLLSTLDDIIDVSNMEVGTFNFNFTTWDVNQLCQERMEETRELLPSGIAFLYQPQNEGLQLHSDRKRVGQVLHNLLSNACKNTTKGAITLSVAHHIANDSIQFVVTDTGCGIPPEKSAVIFEHFEKLDHYSPGLGLGLYVCRLIARALGGDIYLDTSYKDGARFVFTVPNSNETT